MAEHQRFAEWDATKCVEGGEGTDHVDRYVKAVAKALPVEQREDISNELTEDIRSEMEDRERELGRPLSESEREGLLKQRGNPLVLAARYRQDHRSVAFGRQIIGPVLYPFYIKVLSCNLGLTFLVIAIVFTALAVSGVLCVIGMGAGLRNWFANWRGAGRPRVVAGSFLSVAANPNLAFDLHLSTEPNILWSGPAFV